MIHDNKTKSGAKPEASRRLLTKDEQRKLTLKSAALAMIYLTLSLTFISALALRAEATFEVAVTGQDQVPNFRRTNDTTMITVYADSDTVTLLSNAGGLNLSCTNATAGGYLCTYTFPEAYQSPGQYTLNLQQQSGTPTTTSATYIVDGSPPTFTRANINQLGGSLSATYAVHDTASPTTPDCSGVVAVKLVVNDNVLATDTPSGNPCDVSGVLTAPAPGLSGSTNIYLLATDRLGNTGQSPLVTRDVDTTPPVLPSDFQLLRNGVDVAQVSNASITDIRVTLSFTVTETHLATVTVDASNLTTDPSLQAAYKNLRPACQAVGDTNTCTVPNLQLNPGQSTIFLAITAADTSGNQASGVAAKTLTIQNTQPTITYLGKPDQCDQCFLAKGPSSLLAVVEAPGGMLGAGIFFSLDGQTIAATNCTDMGGSTWDCMATAGLASGANGATKTLTVLPSSMDDLGNPVTGILSKEFILDTERPQLLTQPMPDAACPTAGQQLHVTTKVKDDTSPSLTIMGNVSAVTDQQLVQAPCTSDGNGTFDCTLTIDSFLSTHSTGDVPMWISDEAGNNVSLRLMGLEVCEALADATPNYITSLSTAGSLPSVDKRLASLIPYRVVVPLKLAIIGGAKVTQVRAVTCTTPLIVGPSYVMNEFTDAPLLVTYYEYDGVWPNDTVPLNCTLDFTIRRGNNVYVKPETENLSVELPLVRQELNNPAQAIRDKETMLVNDINDLQKSISSKASIDKSIGKMCSIAEKIGEANSALQAVKGILYGVALVLSAFGGGSGQALWSWANNVLSNYQGFVYNYIWPIGWISGGGMNGDTSAAAAFSKGGGTAAVGYLVKWTCGLYECKPYDAKEWAKLGLEIGTVNNWLGLGRSMANLKDGTKVVAEDGASYTYHAPPADDFTNDKTGAVATKPVTAGSIGASEPYHASDLQAIRGGKPLSYAVTYSEKSTGDTLGTFYVYDKTAFDKTYGDALKNLKTDKYFNAVETNPYLYNLQQMNGIVQALPGDDWIVNPYRSTRYDALCYPAQLYNTRKEKQLKCIELKCIQENAQTGLPITQCEEKYSAQTCLYLESAQARLHGSIGDILQRAVAGIALQIITAYGVQTFVHSVCGDYRPDQVQQWGPLSKGVVAVGCGLIGAFTNLQELKSFKDSLRSQNPTVPQGQDYCTGVDGVQPDSTAGN